ncbi:MAG TPA: two-component system regulatory protein YycI [Clostridiales bacterium]|nr:two-component system regulatory protein YycI [Clostridiales bacterium]
MDVSKAKNVVIVLLLVFNVFLLANMLIFRSSQGVSKETLENTRLILEQRGIRLECEIPSKPGGNSRLVYIKSELDGGNIAERLLGTKYEASGDGSHFFSSNGKIEFTGIDSFIYTAGTEARAQDAVSVKEAEDAAMKFMKEKGLLAGKYVLDRSEENGDGGWTLDYIETYGGSLLFDNCFSITLRGREVSRLEYRRHQFKGFSNENIEQFEAYQALLAYFKEKSDMVITSIDSGYKLEEPSMGDVETVELLPVWRVKIKGMHEPVYISPHDT